LIVVAAHFPPVTIQNTNVDARGLTRQAALFEIRLCEVLWDLPGSHLAGAGAGL
jgi:hypothetical protein